MMGGYLEDGLLPYSDDGTSKEAAQVVAPRAEAQRMRVFCYIAEKQSATCDEVEVGLHLPHQSASARINELRRAGLIEKTGRSRKTRTGCAANVYRVMPLVMSPWGEA